MRRYGALVLFTGLFGVGLAVRYLFGAQSRWWEIWSSIDVSFAVALGVLAFMAYRDIVREKDQIRLVFDIKGEHIDTGLCLLRKDCTRSEVMGVMRLLCKDHAPLRYDARHLHALLEEVNRVQSGKAGKLYIPLHPEERAQFELHT